MTQQQSTKMPTSKARTAYGLLNDVIKLVVAEPKRMHMGEWLATSVGVETGFDDPPPLGFPSCGTVGCIGGWTEVLAVDYDGYSAGDTLGLSAEQEKELFMDNDLMSADNPQTLGHATAVVAHIRKFQKKYRAQLLAKKVSR